MSETMTGSELARLFLHRGTTAADVAAMDLELLTTTVECQRKEKLSLEAVGTHMSDEQIAGIILEYARSEPSDWPIRPAASDRWVILGLGALGGLGTAVILLIILHGDLWDVLAIQPEDIYISCLCFPFIALFGGVLGALIAFVVTRAITTKWPQTRVAFVAGMVGGLITAVGYCGLLVL